MYLRQLLFALLLIPFSNNGASAQDASVPKRWIEATLESIRQDFARPPVHARNLFHVSIAMYDAWAALEHGDAQCYLLGNTVGAYTCSFNGINVPQGDKEAAQREAISFAAYRVLCKRFQTSPNSLAALQRFRSLMNELGYDWSDIDADYSSGRPAALGNYIGQQVIAYGLQDGSNEANDYAIQHYVPSNPVLKVTSPGNPSILHPNRWQPLQLPVAIDQNGNPIAPIQKFQSPEWGRVTPFALTEADKKVFVRDSIEWWVYHDPGPFEMLDTSNGNPSEAFKWNYALVSAWGAHLDPNDGVLWDISPASIGNNHELPGSYEEMKGFYKFFEGGDISTGRPINPKTGQPYTPQIVPRGDYTRVLAQFWADGPNSETPPGHWFAILNKVTEHPDFVPRYNGKGPILSPLEWDVKAYLTLGAAVHDAAISAWGIKGWYDSVRPISAIRYMADKGQSSDPTLPRYHPEGLPLIPGYIELVQPGDPLAGAFGENIHKIKLYTWMGHSEIVNPQDDIAGVGWILAEKWTTYQRKTFVTPPFAGYISGHSTYSRAAAEVLTSITGDEYFPGGMGEYLIQANSGFLGFEKGPSVDVSLQWATYRDASDQTSLSRIWGSIHPPMDDISGRKIGMQCGQDAFNKARNLFYKDQDGDGVYSYEDCDDLDPDVHPNATDLCDGKDNDCDGSTDEDATFSLFYADLDHDGYGSGTPQLFSCQEIAQGFVKNDLDCDDSNPQINPQAVEICDGLDNDCNGTADDNVPYYKYYVDADFDGYGNSTVSFITCLPFVQGFVQNGSDCDDSNSAIHPNLAETCDNLDNDCDGMVDDSLALHAFYADLDADGYGNEAIMELSCVAAITGYVEIGGDCNDADPEIHPGAPEICDNKDNNCDGVADEGLVLLTYYLDDDGDGYGNPLISFSSCFDHISGYVSDSTDCNDDAPSIYPGAPEIIDLVDNNCNGLVDEVSATLAPGLMKPKIYPNPVRDMLMVEHHISGPIQWEIYNISGKLELQGQCESTTEGRFSISCKNLLTGVYILKLRGENNATLINRFVRCGQD